MNNYLEKIFELLGPARRKLPGLVLLFLFSSFLDLVGLGLIGPYVSLVTDPKALDGTLGEFVSFLKLPLELQPLLVTLGIVLIIIFLLKAAMAIFISRAILRFSFKQQAKLRTVLMSAYQQMPFVEFLRRNSSEYIYTIHQLTLNYSGGVLVPGLRTISDLVIAFAIIGFLAWQNILVLVVLLVVMGGAIYTYDRLFRRNLRIYGERVNQAAIKIVKGINEGMVGLKEIRILGKEAYFHNIVQAGAEDYASLWVKNQVISAAPRYLLEALLVTLIVLFVLVSLLYQQDLQTIIPTLSVFGLASLRLLPAATGLSANLLQLRFNRDAIFRLHDDFVAVAHLEPDKTKCVSKELIRPFEVLTLEGVCFTYPGSSQLVLNNVTLQLRKGESIGLIGASGSGKTTLVDVILGLLKAQTGKVSYNHGDLQNAMFEWRSQVAYLPQDVFLIDDTLAHNVALGVETSAIDISRLNEALRQARLDELVPQLPNGVDTLLGERGVRISGGQRQRVALARAFYHGREVLVMDEATSALDNETESEIVDEICRLRGKKTMIVIAHRLTTVQHCDRIYRLQLGRIIEVGTPDEIF